MTKLIIKIIDIGFETQYSTQFVFEARVQSTAFHFSRANQQKTNRFCPLRRNLDSARATKLFIYFILT